MRRADFRDVHLKTRMLADERSGSAGVVEMDVREQQVADVGQGQAAFFEPLLEGGDAGRGPAVVERETVRGLEQVDADDALVALMVEVHRIRHSHAPDPM